MRWATGLLWNLLLCTASHAAVLRGQPLLSRRTLVSFGAASFSMPYAAQAVEQQSGRQGQELAPSVPGTPLSLRATCEATARLSGNEERLPTSLFSRPFYGLETPDVAYPDWCLGRWAVTSSLTQVLAPAGPDLFAPGRNGTSALLRARAEMELPALKYDCRWRRNSDGMCVVDRSFNVASISRASMGPRAVQDVNEESPDRQTLILAPSSAPRSDLYRAELQVVSRHTDPASAATDSLVPRFDCAEVVRQTVRVVPGEKSSRAPPPPSVKEVEAICLYELQRDGSIRGTQRTATYLVADAAYTADSSLAEQQERVVSAVHVKSASPRADGLELSLLLQ